MILIEFNARPLVTLLDHLLSESTQQHCTLQSKMLVDLRQHDRLRIRGVQIRTVWSREDTNTAVLKPSNLARLKNQHILQTGYQLIRHRQGRHWFTLRFIVERGPLLLAHGWQLDHRSTSAQNQTSSVQLQLNSISSSLVKQLQDRFPRRAA